MSNNTTDYQYYFYDNIPTSNTDYVSMYFEFASSIMISAFSLIGNSLVAFILLKLKELKKEPIFRYLLVAAIFDQFNGIMIWPSYFQNVFLINQQEISCKLFYFFLTTLQEFSSWINVTISIDTYVMVKFSANHQKRKKIRYQVIILSSIFAILCCLNVPWAYYPTVVSTIGCYSTDPFIAIYLSFYKTILQIFIPCILMLVFSSLTYLELVIKKRRVRRHNILRKEKNLFKTSLFFNILFFVCNIPYFFQFLISYFTNYMFSQIVTDILMFIQYLFYSLDIFIYLISNRIFREYCFYLFCCSINK
jgi:hypothetical protein